MSNLLTFNADNCTSFYILCQKLTIPSSYIGMRIDKCFFILLNKAYSRTQICQWLKCGYVSLEGCVVKSSYKVKGNEIMVLKVPNSTIIKKDIATVKLPFSKVYEDQDLLLINKEINCVVHGANSFTGEHTLMDFIIHLYPNNRSLQRFGLVHRLDKDTSGLLLIAKNDSAYACLTAQFAKRMIKRRYYALVHGYFNKQAGIVQTYLKRDHNNRYRFVVSRAGKQAITYYKVISCLRGNYSLLECSLHTGRTHQIRVHMSYLNHPIVGDKIYYSKYKKENKIYPAHMLCAYKISFYHPTTSEILTFTVDMPEFMKLNLNNLGY